MVAAAHPLAVEAGCEVLADGGSAIDAAIAVQAVLTVIEPEASGLAGGTIITYWDNESKRVRFFDGLARAPEAVTDGLRTPTEEDVANCGVTRFSSRVQYNGRAFGVPGTLKVLDLVHQEYGNTDWQNLFGAAGGGPIPDYVAQTILGVLVQNLDPQAAINQGHFSGQGLTTNCSGVTGARSELERDTPIAGLEAELSLLVPPCLRVTSLRSGLAAVEVVKPGDRKKSMKSKKSKKSNKAALLGAADPRRDGVAMGL